MTKGCCNVARHIQNARAYGIPVVVAINQVRHYRYSSLGHDFGKRSAWGKCMACQGQGSGEGQQPSMRSDEALDKGSDCSSLTASAFRK